MTNKASMLAERAATYGIDSLRDTELMHLVAGKDTGVLPAAVVALDAHQLEEHGFTRYKARQIEAVVEVARRGLGLLGGDHIDGPVSTLKYFAEIAHADKEHTMVLYLNARNQVIHKEVVSVGILNATVLHPREVFKPAIRLSAASLIVGHNHPSGELHISQEDLKQTRRLVETGEVIGIEMFDHVIVSGDDFLSFKERGFIE